MPLPYTSLWDTLYPQHSTPTVFMHKSPQVWASYLSLVALASQGGQHVLIAKGYEKEAFFRSAKKWLETLGLEGFIDKDGVNLGKWGRLSIMYPLSSIEIISTAKTCFVASPFIFKRGYFKFLSDTLPEGTPLWIFHSEVLPSEKGDNALKNQIYKRFFWHTKLPTVFIPPRENQSFDNWVLSCVWEELFARMAEKELGFL